MQTSFFFDMPVRIYYEDTDAGGIVYHASYLRFAERARTEFLRSLSFSQADLKNTYDIIFVVKKIEITYNRPAYLDESLVMRTSLSELKSAYMVFVQSLLRNTEQLTQITATVVSVKGSSFKPTRLPLCLYEALDKYPCRSE